MTQEEINDYNRRCAEFLGWEKAEQLKNGYCAFNEACDQVTIEELKFHSDWNWIHEVIEKILKNYRTDFYLDFDMPISDTFTVSIGSDGKYNSKGESTSSSKEAVVQAINQFLIYYNNEH